MYIASSTADSPCNKEKKKDPPEHSYLKQLQLSMKPVYENGISRDTHKKKQFSKESHNTLYPKRPNFYEKKRRSSLSLSISKKASSLFSPLTRKSQQECNFFYITIIRPSPVDKRKRKKQ